MIRTIDIRLNAAHPELPLPEATTYQNAPSTAFLRGVPKSCGLWQITAVSVAATFPDNSTTTRAAVLSAGDVWVATIPACATSGRTTSGLRILADGTDENGDAVTGYVLGVADFAVATFDIAPAPGETSYTLRYFDNVPNPPHKGDVATVGGTLKYYDGTAWQPFAGVPSPSTSAPQMDGTASAGSSADYARGDHRHPTDTTRASTADATLTERGFSEWVTSQTGEFNGEIWYYPTPTYGGAGTWYMSQPMSEAAECSGGPDATSLTFGDDDCLGGYITFTRTALGYRLGPDADTNPNRNKPLASEAEAEALRQGKTSRSELCAAWAANTVYTTTSFVIHNNALYRCTTAHTSDSTWDSTKWTAATIADVLALYLPKSGGTVDTLTVKFPITVGFAGNERQYGVNSISQGSGHIDFPSTTGTLALTADLRYALTTKTIDNGAVTLDDRAINAVAVSSSLASLTVNFPTATSGKARDFGLRLTVASGITIAPQIVLPQGVVCENADGEAPEIGADGAATILYFTETASGVFLVKGEVVQTIS